MGDNSTNVIPFNFGKQQVRTLLIDGEPWFAAQDVLDSLEYAETYKPSRAMSHVPDAWKGVHRLHTPGGTQQTLMISEQGLYFVLGRSDKPKALPFQMWLAGDVLPAIRKTGAYVDQHNAMGDLVGAVIGSSGEVVLDRVIDQKAMAIPSSLRRSYRHTMKSRLRSRFNVQRTALIPAEFLSDACNFVAAYVFEGDLLPKREQVQIVGGPQKRYLVSFDYKGEQRVEEVADDACVLSTRDLIKGMVMSPGDIPVSTPDMFEFLMAAVINLRGRFEYMARRTGA
ncbi:BRO family protein [Pseudomonas sp. ER28]|uniref:BRO-N domain-containing protein n=1 Tax=Pseudomonas sp. ER28 TaxID=3033801 RepID=UPI0023E03758|nr:BRO family protein [Pseudomonas sp. ER28]MDF3175055.1 BRO family protein [Pseudomonas sp. ER28]